MKKAVIRMVITLMIFGLVFTTPMVAEAATEKATSEKELAKIVSAHAMKREANFKVKYTGPQNVLDDLFDPNDWINFLYGTLSMCDDPNTSDDADYLVGNINNDSNEYLYELNGDVLTFKLKYYETSDQTKYVNEHIPEILRGLGITSGSMSNYDKVKKVHDYVCNLITYTSTGKDYESTVYGAIKYNKALCNSYALCMYKLLVEAGIPCKWIGGDAGTGRDKGGHAWNIVALGDKWYNLDATWDDDDDYGEIGYDYFLKGSSDFDESDPKETHKMDKPFRTGEFAAAFPIAKTAFKKGMDDVNVNVKIGDSSVSTVTPTDPENPADPEEPEVKYTLKDLVYWKYPEKGTFAVKKGATQYLWLYLNEGAEEVIDKVTYKVVKGKANIKKIKNYGISEYRGEYYTDLTFKGKKKGKVQVKIILKLKNGQSLSYTFKGKVK